MLCPQELLHGILMGATTEGGGVHVSVQSEGRLTCKFRAADGCV